MTPTPVRFVSVLRRGAVTSVALLSCAGLASLSLADSAQAAAVGVGLGTASPFGVLAGAGVTNTGPTTLRGDLGTYPTTSETGTGTLIITGVNHGGDAVTQGAKRDLQIGYDTAAGEGPPHPITADLAGRTLTAGVYRSASTLGLTGDLTLDAGGNPDAVFVFQAGSTLKTGSASRVTLTNGAQACHVFWQVGSSATLGTASVFRGSILALTSISVTTGVTIDGRVLALNGAVTLDTDTITTPTCTLSSPPGPPSSPPASSPPSSPPASSPPSSPPPSSPPASSPPASSPPASSPPAGSPPAGSPPSSPPAGSPPSSHPVTTTTSQPVGAPMGTTRTGRTAGRSGLPLRANTPRPTVTFGAPGQPAADRPAAAGVPLAGLQPSAGQVPATSPVASAAQIRQVPIGAVHAGDGSASTDNQRSPVLSGVSLALVVTGATGVVVARRHRHGQP